MKPILVIDHSPSLRETLRIVLGREYDVTLAASWDAVTAAVRPALIVAGLPPPPRDDHAIGTALARLAPEEIPLLLLHRPAEVDLHALASPSRRVDFLPKPFDAHAVRARVRTLVTEPGPRPARAREHQRRYLEYPFLSATTAALARQAVATDLPVLLLGERGSGSLDVGRALHVFGGRTGAFVVTVAARLSPDALRHDARLAAPEHSDGGTLYVEDVHETPAETQHDLLALLQGHGAAAHAPVRVVAATSEDLEACVASGRLIPELAYALAVFPLPLTPLRERTQDIPPLVEILTADLVTRLRLEPVRYTAAALERLTQYLWFGNIAELEAVLARSLAVHRPRLVEPAQLVFFPADVGAASGAAPVRDQHRAADNGVPTAPNLEIVLGELAHELRNPMVTIKTFAQHLDSVLDDPEVRARFASLTGEAITRMDALLETLLDFARFRTPIRQATDARILLERALAERVEDLARKSVRVERDTATPAMVDVDEAQILFALRSLLDGLVRDLVPHEPLRVCGGEGGTLTLAVRAERSTAERLAAYVEEDNGAMAGETPPLSFTLASALIRRNGGALEVRSDGEGVTLITVTLPSVAA